MVLRASDQCGAKVCFDAPHQNGSSQDFDNLDKLTRWHCRWFTSVWKKKAVLGGLY